MANQGKSLFDPCRCTIIHNGFSQGQLPCLSDKVMAETVMCFLCNKLKSYLLIDMAGFHKDTIGPEHQFVIATASSETNTLLDETSTQAQAACFRFNQQQSQFGDRLAALHDKDRANDFPIHLRN